MVLYFDVLELRTLAGQINIFKAYSKVNNPKFWPIFNKEYDNEWFSKKKFKKIQILKIN